MSKKIVIASVLKPVNDVRSYRKVAQSLAKTNKYEVNIIGNAGKKGSEGSNIIFHPHQLKRNQWFKRLLLRDRILIKVLRLKPRVLIITTYELINIAVIAKWMIGCKLVYDVQENYSKNVLLKRNAFRWVYAKLIRFIEWYGSLFIDHYWLAETCYNDELNFHRDRYTIAENKALKIEMDKRNSRPLRMLFSGTISTYSGAELALETMVKMIQNQPDAEGYIIGQIHDPKLLENLKTQTLDYPTIQVEISENPVSYDRILERIQWANLGIIAYQENEVNRNKVPTKLYEYSRYQLPYLVQKETSWAKVGDQLGGAIIIDFGQFDPVNTVQILENESTLFKDPYPSEATWESDSQIIINSINRLDSSN